MVQESFLESGHSIRGLFMRAAKWLRHNPIDYPQLEKARRS